SEFFAPAVAAYGADTIVFVGRMDYYPNQPSMFDFCANVLPRLRAQRPTVKLQLVGAAPSQAVSRLANDPGGTVTCSVADERAYDTRAALTVATLRIARG